MMMKRTILANETELVYALKNTTFKRAMKLYKQGDLEYKQFIQFFPETLKADVVFMKQFELMYKGAEKLPAPFQISAKDANKYRNGIIKDGSLSNRERMMYHPNSDQLVLMYKEGLLPVTSTGKLAEAEAKTVAIGLTKGKNVASNGAAAREIRRDTKYVEQVLQKPSSVLPEGWFRKNGFPKTKEQWRKEWEVFTDGKQPIEPNTVMEQRVMETQYWQVEAYKRQNGTRKLQDTDNTLDPASVYRKNKKENEPYKTGIKKY